MLVRQLLLASIVLATMSPAAMGKCSSVSQLSFRPDTNDVQSVSAVCDSHGIGLKQFTPGFGYEFTRVFVASSPRHGTLKTHSFGYEYRPRPGFSGDDGFALKVCAVKDGVSGCSTLNYSVTIQQ